MSRVLIVNAPFRSRQPSVHRCELLGIEYLAASVRAAGHEAWVWDPTLIEPQIGKDGCYYWGPSESVVNGRIRSIEPDVVGISCHYGFAADYAFAVARQAKAISGSIRTVMGGLFVSVFRSRVLQECEALDFGLIGEAEDAFPALLELLQAGESAWEKIDGLCWRQDGRIRENPKTQFIAELDRIPLPARDLVDLRAYMHGSQVKRLYGLGFRPALSLLTSRSCPYGCTFCNMKLVHGPRWRGRSVESVVQELEEITARYRAEHVFVMDDNFLLKPDRAKAICQEVVRRKLRFRWNTPNGISAKGMDAELADLMKASGCANVCIAIESGDERMRTEVMNKKVSDSEIAHAVECLRRAQIPVVGFVIVGMPGEDDRSFRQSVRFLKSLPLTSLVV